MIRYTSTQSQYTSQATRQFSRIPAWILAGIVALGVARAGQTPPWFSAADDSNLHLKLPADGELALSDWLLGDNLELVEDDLLGQQVWEHQGNGTSWIRSRRPVEGQYEVRARIRLADDFPFK